MKLFFNNLFRFIIVYRLLMKYKETLHEIDPELDKGEVDDKTTVLLSGYSVVTQFFFKETLKDIRSDLKEVKKILRS